MAYQLNNFLGSTKVCKFNASFITNKNVCTLYEACQLKDEKERTINFKNSMNLLEGSRRYLDIPVHNSILVKVFEAQQQLFRIHSNNLYSNQFQEAMLAL